MAPKSPAHVAKLRENVKKATAAKKKKAADRKAAIDSGAPDPYPHVRPVAGKRFTFDDCVTAVLEADDAIESRRIIEAMNRGAVKGDVKAATFLVERALGKPLQKVQLSGGLTLETMDAVLPGPKAEATDVIDPVAAD